jgi:hypothetical protein
MALTIEFAPIDPKLFKSQADFRPFGETICNEFSQRNLYRGYASGFNLELCDTGFNVVFIGMCGGKDQDIHYIAREVGTILDDIGLRKLFYVQGTQNSPRPSDLVFSCENIEPRQTRNSALFDKLNIADEKIPQQFICQLSQHLMDEPAYIKSQPEIKYNLSHLRYWLFQKGIMQNPFTRTDVALKDIVLDNELKSEILNFLRTAIQENLLEKKELNRLVVEYRLENMSPISLGKGLRVAAANKKVNDLKVFIQHVDNIDRQDENELNRKTALHWAVIKESKECAETLVKAGARWDIPDYFKKTALDYAKEKNNNELLAVFIKENSSEQTLTCATEQKLSM